MLSSNVTSSPYLDEARKMSVGADESPYSNKGFFYNKHPNCATTYKTCNCLYSEAGIVATLSEPLIRTNHKIWGLEALRLMVDEVRRNGNKKERIGSYNSRRNHF